MNVFLIFCMNIWTRESCRHDGYHDSSQLAKNWIERLLQSHVWTCSTPNSIELLRCYSTTGETWIYYYTSEMLEQLELLISSGEHSPKKAKHIPSVRKVISAIFSDLHGIFFIHHLKKRKWIQNRSFFIGSIQRWINGKATHLAEKNFSSITTKHQLILQQLSWPTFSNCSLIQYILQIWPLVTSFNCQHKTLSRWKKLTSSEDIIAETNFYLQSSRNHMFWTTSKS